MGASFAAWGAVGGGDCVVGSLMGRRYATDPVSRAGNRSGGETMYSGRPGDLRGLAVLMGSIGLGGVGVLRTASVFLPKPWRIYTDRLEFTFVAMLWICWTSATMAFSYFTLVSSVCAQTVHDIFTPTCHVLTFDLTLLHLLSTATLALLLVILSTALSPNYYASLSPSFGEGADGKDDEGDMLVMWELALASPPSSPLLGPDAIASASADGAGYGTRSTTTPIKASGDGSSKSDAQEHVERTRIEVVAPRKRDKFAEGRVWTYIPLLLSSIGVAIAGGWVLGQGDYVMSNVFVVSVALISAAFALSFLIVHYKQRHNKATDSARSSYILRHDRALEVGFAGALFLLWPFAAIIYTLYPSTPNRPCTHPAASAIPLSDEEATVGPTICFLSGSIVFLSWLSAWIVLGRVLGLIFPMPDMSSGAPTLPVSNSYLPQRQGTGDESTSLLHAPKAPSNPEAGPSRPQVKYGRIVAGEAFELGDDEE